MNRRSHLLSTPSRTAACDQRAALLIMMVGLWSCGQSGGVDGDGQWPIGDEPDLVQPPVDDEPPMRTIALPPLLDDEPYEEVICGEGREEYDIYTKLSEELRGCTTLLTPTAFVDGLRSPEVPREGEGDLDVFLSLRHAKAQLLFNRTHFPDVDGFQRLNRAEDRISISNNGFLENVRGFKQLRYARVLGLTNIPELSSLEGLEALSHVGGFSLSGVDKIVNLDGLGRLERIEGPLRLHQLTQLQDVMGLAALREVGGFLQITYNRELLSLRGLEGVHEVESLEITHNPKLRSLRGLSGLERVRGDVEIHGNTMLSGVEIDVFLSGLTIDGEVIRARP